MATPVLNNLTLAVGAILILPDVGDKPTTGTVVEVSGFGGVQFCGYIGLERTNHVLFVREMSTEVTVDGIGYLAMNSKAIVGIIPE